MKFTIVQLAAVLACVLAAAGARAQATEHPRTLGVNGHGEVRAQPDRATVTLGVEARKPKLEEARAEVTKTVEAILKLTRDMKIDQKFVRATRITAHPEYSWDHESRERRLLGYFVARQVEIELRDLEKLGQLIERAADLGVNQLGDPALDSSKRNELTRQALAEAVADARRNAEVVANAAHAKLGPPRIINANTGYSPGPPIPMQRSMMVAEAAGKGAASYQSGEMTFTADVNVQYDLIPSEQ